MASPRPSTTTRRVTNDEDRLAFRRVQSIVLLSETPEDFRHTTKVFLDQYKPLGDLEHACVEEMITARWHTRRYKRIMEVLKDDGSAMPQAKLDRLLRECDRRIRYFLRLHDDFLHRLRQLQDKRRVWASRQQE